MRCIFPLRVSAVLAGLLSPPAPAAAPDCQLCAPKAANTASQAPRKPLHIEIDSTLDFSLAAYREPAGGTIEVDSQTGSRRVTGGLVGLGGPAVRGVVRMTGEPFARIKVDFPATMQLRSPGGATATISDIRTTLSANPVIGANGELVFSFGGRMTVNGGAAGDFQGRFAISADYQ